MFRSLFYKTFTALALIGIIYAPLNIWSSFSFVPKALAVNLPGEEIGDKILDSGLKNLFDNYEDVRETLKVGAGVCAATAYLISLLPSSAVYKVQIASASNEFKDNFLDCLMYQVGNALIEDMLRSLTKWVQGGFHGNPVFVSNINRYTRDIADDAFSGFIESKFGGDIPFFCTPFQADLQLQLTLLYQQSRENHRLNACSLTSVVSNVENFLEGDFYSGGWAGWQATFSNPENNPYGAYFSARSELATQIASMVGAEEKEISSGKGFLSKKVQDCYLTPPGGGTPQPYDETQVGPPQGTVTCDEPRTVTPGSFAAEQIGKKFGLPDERLTFSDELDELLGAIIQKLVSNVLKSDGGLAEYVIASSTSPLFPIPIDEVPPDEPAGPAGDSQCFVKNGVFLTPTPGSPSTEITSLAFPLPQNVSYDYMKLEMDVTNNGWFPDDLDGTSYNLFFLFRSNAYDNFGYANVKAPNKNIFVLRQGVALPFLSAPRSTTKPNAIPDHTTYHVIYTYDTVNQKVIMHIEQKGSIGGVDGKAGGNRVLGEITMTPNVEHINTGDERFKATFGLIADPSIPGERPAYGWTYSNLKVQFLSGSTNEPATCVEAPAAPVTGGPGDGGHGPRNPGGDE